MKQRTTPKDKAQVDAAIKRIVEENQEALEALAMYDRRSEADARVATNPAR